jgi:hypothetical protein
MVRKVISGVGLVWMLCLVHVNIAVSALTASSLEVDARGGRVLRIADFDLRQGGAKFNEDPSYTVFHERDSRGLGHYRILVNENKTWRGPYGTWRVEARNTLPLKPNRSYIISALLNVKFERPEEVNMGLWTMGGGGTRLQAHINGIFNDTGAEWKRWEWEFTTDQRVHHGQFEIHFERFPPGRIFRIADLAFIELPEKPLTPYEKGQGGNFRGGPGNLPMKIERTSVNNKKIEVVTTGAVYTFDTMADTITCRQRVETQRDLVVWKLSQSLAELKILSKTDTECILANDKVTFGVQSDSLLFVVPQADLVLKGESKIGGKWNRLAAGHLLVRDDYGGFNVNPDVPLGSGRLSRVDLGVEPGRISRGLPDFGDKADDQSFVSQVEPGWGIKYWVSPGERLAIGVFPPRPYPWKESFHSHFLVSSSRAPLEYYAAWGRVADIVILWNFTERSWAMSYGRDHVPYDTDHFRKHVEAAKAAGLKPIPYMSPYYYYSRDAQEVADQCRMFRDTFGLQGAYFDAVPSLEWIVAYEQMRLAREIFPDGAIVLHATGHPYDGGPPLGEPSLKIPAVETYSDVTYTGEHVYGYGKNWAYAKYVTSQYRLSNCVGVMKDNGWEGLTYDQRNAMMLRYNGRARMLPPHHEGMTDLKDLKQIEGSYISILRQLEKLWREKGDDPDFYEKYYLPKAIELTNDIVPAGEVHDEPVEFRRGTQFEH